MKFSPRIVALAATSIACLGLAACAASPPEAASETASPPPPPEPAATPVSEDISARPPTDPDVMYHVMAAETLGVEGDVLGAAGEYLRAAMISKDPAIAERATRVAISAQSWQQAAMAADRWALLDPISLDARELAAVAMLRVGDYTGAEHQMHGILDLMASEQARAWTLIATLLARADNPDKASAVLDRLLEDRGAQDNADARFAQSQLAARRGELAAARALAEEAVGLSPETPELHIWAGRLAASDDDLETALGHYEAAWKLAPEERRVALAYAELLRRGDAPDEAQAVLAGLEDTAEVRFTRIAYAVEDGDMALAKSLLEGMAETRADDVYERAFFAAQAAELVGEPETAIEWYARVERGERAVYAALRRAYLLAEAGRLSEARNLLGRMRTRPDASVIIESYEAESQILLDAGLGEEAAEVLTQAIDRLGPETRLLYARALTDVRLGRLDRAERDLRAIIEQEPQNAAALNALGYTLTDLTDRHEEAEALILQAYALDPEEPSIIDSMGWVAYRLGRLDDAEAYLRDALARDENAEIAAHLGEVLWVQGRRDEALETWRRALAWDADNTTLLETLERFGVEP